MQPANWRFGGGSADTLLNPIVAVAMLILIALIFTLPRHKVITPFLLGCFTIPLQQVVVLGGTHFTMLRILTIAALIRRATLGPSREGNFPGGMNGIDRVVILWAIWVEVMSALQFMELQVFIHNMGDLLDLLGGFLVVRYFIVDRETVRRAIKALVVVSVIQGVCMLNEQIAHFNVFGYIGGIGPWLTLRNGSIRSEGVLGCISAGAFAAALIPLFLGLLPERKSRKVAYAGLLGATVMVFTSNSSTSLMALSASVVALAMWPLRKQMRLVRQGLVVVLIALHLVMKAPVWALIAKIDLTGSSSSYHRFYLVDNCIKNVGDWWLMGYKDYSQWGFMMFDLCDQWVVQAVLGGLVGLVAYILIFSRSFGRIGRIRKRVEGDRGREWFLWCLGSTLFSVAIAHFGINYAATTEIGLFTFWTLSSMATFEAKQPAEAKAEVPRDARMLRNPKLVGAA